MKTDFHLLRWLFKRTGRRIPAILLMTAANVGSALLGVYFALGTKGVINAAIDGDSQDLLRAALVQLAIIAGILICVTVYRYTRAKLGATLDRDWKETFVHKILSGDYAALSEFHTGELLNRLNNDVRSINDGMLDVLPGLASMVTKLGAVVIVLLSMEPVFTAVLLLAGLIVGLTTGAARRHLRDLNKAVSRSEGRLGGFMQEIFEKLLLVQAMHVEDEVIRRGDSLMETRYSLQKKRWMITLVANSCISLLGYGSGFVALVWCARQMQLGLMTFGELTAMTQLVSQLQNPFVNLSGVLPKYIAMTAACERMMELENACRKRTAPAGAPSADYRDVTAICARNLTFSYGRDQVLDKSGFHLPKGAFAVITGPSGIGKSTLLKLLLGIFPPLSGELYLDTRSGPVPVSEATRDLFAYVPQGNLLFSGTLRENLLLTRPDATEEEIHRAVYVSCMDAFLPQLPEGLETMLGENAHGLSEGQAQRLSIARAVLGDAPILLLDECTSALDAQTEEEVLQRLRALPDKTCIAVTHRPAAMALANWHLMVEGGGIVCKKLFHT